MSQNTDEGPTPAQPGPDFEESIETVRRRTDRRSAEQWARAVFEDAPPSIRRFLLVAWRAGLGLQLAPPSEPTHVLGWQIVAAEPETIRLTAPSSLLAAELSLSAVGATVILTTSVTYRRRPARLLWALALPIHRRLVPYLMGRAAKIHPTPKHRTGRHPR